MAPVDERARQSTDVGGFTLIELVIAVGLAAFAFAALAALLTSGLKTLAIAKARTQGNEVATQGIEDLQRVSFDSLILCAPPSGAAPSGLSDTVLGASCPSPVPANYGEDPCNALNPSDAPDSEYSCSKVNVSYTVKRFIAWADAGHTDKRLAVFVSWRDSVGVHTVSQQSSLRSPSAASIVGFANPTLTSPSATPSPSTIDVAGHLTGSVVLTVTATNLDNTPATPDRVFARFLTIDPSTGDSTPSTVELNPGTPWTITLSGSTAPGNTYTFGAGSQFITFTAVRASDGKANSAVSTPPIQFCPAGGCNAAVLPSFVSTNVPATVALNPSGGQKADFTVSAVTQNMTATDLVQVILPTLSGAQVLNLQANTSTCTISSCTWSVTVPKAAGYAFAAGNKALDFSAAQDKLPPPSVDQGNTTAAVSSLVTFG